MTSDGVVRCILVPLSINDPSYGSGPLRQLRRWRYELDQKDVFLSILLGDDQTPDPASLWLPRYLQKRAANLDNLHDIAQLVFKRVLFGEVMKFGPRATDVSKVFARFDLDLVERLLSHHTELRSALQEIIVDDTESVEPSRVYEGASRIFGRISELQRPRDDDLLSMVRCRYDVLRQFYTFLSILLGDPPQDAEPATAVWFPEFLKKQRDCDTLEPHFKLLMGPFVEVLEFGVRATEVAQAFARMHIVHAENLLANKEDLLSTLRRFNTIAEIKDTEELIDMYITPFESGPSTVDVPVTDAEINNTEELIDMIMTPFESGPSTVDVPVTDAKCKDTKELVDMFLTAFESGPSTADDPPTDDAYIKLAALHYGKSEDED